MDLPPRPQRMSPWRNQIGIAGIKERLRDRGDGLPPRCIHELMGYKDYPNIVSNLNKIRCRFADMDCCRDMGARWERDKSELLKTINQTSRTSGDDAFSSLKPPEIDLGSTIDMSLAPPTARSRKRSRAEDSTGESRTRGNRRKYSSSETDTSRAGRHYSESRRRSDIEQDRPRSGSKSRNSDYRPRISAPPDETYHIENFESCAITDVHKGCAVLIDDWIYCPKIVCMKHNVFFNRLRVGDMVHVNAFYNNELSKLWRQSSKKPLWMATWIRLER